MSRSNLLVSGDRRLATDTRSRTVGAVVYDEHFQHVIPTPLGATPVLLSAFVGGDEPDLNVDGSTDAVEKDLAPASDAIYRVSQVALILACSAAIEMTKFGDLAALTNGLKVEWRNADGVVADLLAGQPAKTLNDLAAVFDVGVAELGTSHTIRALLQLPVPMRLDGGAGELLRVTVQDDLSSLVRFRCHALGSTEELT